MEKAMPETRPIIFSAPMVRAILDGRKTQTRRVIKPQPGSPIWCDTELAEGFIRDRGRNMQPIKCPYGQPGDRLWVRETARARCYGRHRGKVTWIELCYRADDGIGRFDRESEKPFKWTHTWTPSIHMPRWASRITLEVTGVRVERLQEISVRDAGAEIGWDYSWPIPDHAIDGHEFRMQFHRLWDSLNAKRGFGWDVNPWVWMVEFRRVGDA
jgi:hypothetical protein